MSSSLKELSCLASLSGRFCSKLRQDHSNTAKTISQETQQPEKHHCQAALDRCHAMKEYCLVLKHCAGSNAKYFLYLGGCKRAAGTHRSSTTTQGHNHNHTAGQAQQTYKPVTPIPFSSEMHMMGVFPEAHVALSSSFMERQTIQQTCTFLS